MMTRALATSVSLALCLGAFGCELLLGKNDYELGSSDAGAVANGDGGATSDALPTADAACPPAQCSCSMLIVSVRRIAFEPVPCMGRTQCQELNVFTNTTHWFGSNS